jgi:hypothetical protein
MPLPFFMLTKPSWPYGSMGHLVVSNGQTVTLSNGTVYDYASVTVDAGGILQFSGSGFAFLGVSGNLVVNGTIKAFFDVPGGYTQTVSGPNSIGVLNTALGESLSFTLPTQTGGKGGYGPYMIYGDWSNNGGSRGNQNSGHGGGGGGSAYYYHEVDGGSDYYSVGGIDNKVAKGPDGLDATAAGPGGRAKIAKYNNGWGNPPISSYYDQGYGGAGGARGIHGGAIYIKVGGLLSGSGAVIADGSNGADGESGGGASSLYPDDTDPDDSTGLHSKAGGAGGGGAGGSGGVIAVKVRSGFSYGPGFVLSFRFSANGVLFAARAGTAGASPASDAVAGVVGSTTIANY